MDECGRCRYRGDEVNLFYKKRRNETNFKEKKRALKERKKNDFRDRIDPTKRFSFLSQNKRKFH